MEVVCAEFRGCRRTLPGGFQGGQCRPTPYACLLLGILPATPLVPLVLLGAKPRCLQKGRATAMPAAWLFKTPLFWQHKLPSEFGTWALWGCWRLLGEGDQSWRTGSVSPPHAPLPLCCSINDSSFPTLQHLQPEVAPFSILYISFGKILRACFLQVTCKGIIFIHCLEADTPLPVSSSQILFANMLVFDDFPALRWSCVFSATVWIFS